MRIVCNHPECTGSHSVNFPVEMQCPASYERHKANSREYYRKNRERVLTRSRLYYLTPKGIQAQLRARAKRRIGIRL